MNSGKAAMDGFLRNFAMGSSMKLSDSKGNLFAAAVA